jgi:SAM-dependent methyltransferase
MERVPPTERYQDLVIKDGRFVGEFDRMYKAFDDPWHQSEPEHNILSVSRSVAMLNMAKYGIRSVVEFGCGLGFYTDRLRSSLGLRVLGVDISPTAIEKARSRFPDSRFEVASITDIGRFAEYDAVLFAEITWYVLPQLQYVFGEMLSNLRGRYFVHNLMFYKGNTQQYGREYFTNLDEFIAFCPFRLVARSEYTSADPSSSIESSTIFLIDPK